MRGFWSKFFQISLLIFPLLLLGEEPFRTFKTATGQGFTGKVLSYEGQTFYIQGKDSKLYPVPFKQLSANDQKYLIEVASSGKIPKGDPRKLVQKNEDNAAGSNDPAVAEQKATDEGIKKPADRKSVV